MIIKTINFGGYLPIRAHYNDAGADVFARSEVKVFSGAIAKVPLGFGIELPDGLVAFVLPRSGMSTREGITTEVVPIDSGYRGEIHAIVYNASGSTQTIHPGDKIAQLVIMPCVIADFMFLENADIVERGTNGFGSTDKRV